MNNIGQMMQKAKELQESMKTMQEEMANTEVSAEAGGGMVKVVVRGDKTVTNIDIDQSLWDEQDKALVEDLVTAAVNTAFQQLDAMMKEKQQGLMAGLPLPPGFGF